MLEREPTAAEIAACREAALQKQHKQGSRCKASEFAQQRDKQQMNRLRSMLGREPTLPSDQLPTVSCADEIGRAHV